MNKMVLLAGLTVLGPLVMPVRAGVQIGDTAPAVKVSKWMNRQPPVLPGDKDASRHVFLVEFWATWCGPCLKSIPHLAELHKNHEKDGLVIIGVSNEEPEKIARFMDKHEKEKKLVMPYFVACDEEMTTTTGWAKDVETIPHAILVDRTGKVVWVGNPLADLSAFDDAIAQTLAGKYDVETAKKAAAAAEKYETLMSDLKVAYTTGDKDAVFKTLDEMISLKPQELQPFLIKRQMLIEFDMTDRVSQWDAQIEAAMRDSAQGLRDLVAFELQKNLGERNPGLLIRCATRASEITDGRDAETLAALAEVQCQLGMIDAAIATQRRALGMASEEWREEMKKVLAYYEGAKAIAGESTIR